MTSSRSRKGQIYIKNSAMKGKDLGAKKPLGKKRRGTCSAKARDQISTIKSMDSGKESYAFVKEK